MTAPTVRGMLQNDLPWVLEMERMIFPSPWTEDVFIAELRAESAFYHVVEAEGAPRGYSGAHMFAQEIHLTNMAVVPGWRRRGLATALMLESIGAGMERGGRYVTLEVRERNHQALAFYRRFGLEELGLRRGYYHDSGEDALIMATGDISAEQYRRLFENMRRRFDAGGGS